MHKHEIAMRLTDKISKPEASGQITELLQSHIDLVAGSHCPPHTSQHPHSSTCTPGGHESITRPKKAAEMLVEQ